MLDSSKKTELFKFDPQLEKEFTSYSAGINVIESIVGFMTQKSNLTELLNSEDSQKRILNCIYDEEFIKSVAINFRYPIYIKENIAIFAVYTSFTTDIFYIRLSVKGVVQINWLGGTME